MKKKLCLSLAVSPQILTLPLFFFRIFLLIMRSRENSRWLLVSTVFLFGYFGPSFFFFPFFFPSVFLTEGRAIAEREHECTKMPTSLNAFPFPSFKKCHVRWARGEEMVSDELAKRRGLVTGLMGVFREYFDCSVSQEHMENSPTITAFSNSGARNVANRVC